MSKKPEQPVMWFEPIEYELADLIRGHRELVALQLKERLMPLIAWIACLQGAADADMRWIPVGETDMVVDWAREWIAAHRDDEGADAEHWSTLHKYISEPFRHSKRFRFNSQYAIAQVNNAYWKRKALKPSYRIVDAIHDVRRGTHTGLLKQDPEGAFIFNQQHVAQEMEIEHWSFEDIDAGPVEPRFHISLAFCEWCIEAAKTYSLDRRPG